MSVTVDRLSADLHQLGLPAGSTVMVHTAFKAIGTRDPEIVLQALLSALGPHGTLLTPALSYLQEPHFVHDTRHTPVCVGFFPEYVRTRAGTLRSLHPTHSVCAIGPRSAELLGTHGEDHTPCGPCSPFRKNLVDGWILMLGCGLGPNTSMHAIEELAPPPYLFGEWGDYTLTDAQGQVTTTRYRMHGFVGFDQRYDRVADLLSPPDLRHGLVGHATAFLINAAALRRAAEAVLRQHPFAFVDPSADRPESAGSL
jgi:aminoglycoside 3-N-acetyltransferase